MTRLLCGLFAAAGLAMPLAAADIDRDHGSFYNRPGATAADLAADAARCKAIAEGADSQVTAVGVLAGGIGGILGGLIAGGRLKRTNIENCLLIRGWRLYALTKAEAPAWKALPPAAREAELATLVGAETPARGGLRRVWRNDYAEPVLWKKF